MVLMLGTDPFDSVAQIFAIGVYAHLKISFDSRASAVHQLRDLSTILFSLIQGIMSRKRSPTISMG